VDGIPAFLRGRFKETFPHSGKPKIFRAPGRVNLIGEHTDYNLGFVLPIALDLASYAVAAPDAEGKLRVRSESAGETREWPISSIIDLEPAHDWSDYVAGVARELILAGFDVHPANLLVHSTVPLGSGLSSSAAFEVSVALALLNGRDIPPLELVHLCQRAENRFVGMPCGIMDQYASVFGRSGAALQIDCRTRQHQPVPLPEGVAIIAVNSMVKHELGKTAYRERVDECAAAVRIIQERHPLVKSLRDATMRHLETLGPAMPELVYRRARHVITENDRVMEFVKACEAADLECMGRKFRKSHESLRDDYEVSCEELDFLVETALAMPAVFGARMTGGGFGGCTVNLVAPQASAEFKSAIAQKYEAMFGIAPAVYDCHPSAGAGEMKLS